MLNNLICALYLPITALGIRKDHPKHLEEEDLRAQEMDATILVDELSFVENTIFDRVQGKLKKNYCWYNSNK